MAIGHWAFGHTKRCVDDFFDWPPNNRTMQWFAWVTTKQQIPGAQLPMLIATFIEEADYYPFYMSCHCGPPLWIYSIPYWDHVLHCRGCLPMCQPKSQSTCWFLYWSSISWNLDESRLSVTGSWPPRSIIWQSVF